MKFILPPFTKENIEKQFKKLSKQFHPDNPGGSVKMFQELTEEKNKLLRYAGADVPDLPAIKKLKRKSVKPSVVFVKPRVIRPDRDERVLRLVFDSLDSLKIFVKQIKKL